MDAEVRMLQRGLNPVFIVRCLWFIRNFFRFYGRHLRSYENSFVFLAAIKSEKIS